MIKMATTACSLLLSLFSMLPAAAQKRGHASGATASKPALKFLDAIRVNAVDVAPAQVIHTTNQQMPAAEPQALKTDFISVDAIESATALQLKYAILLDTEVEQIQNMALFAAIDEWHGTRYRLGGNTKEGIDCSAFVQAIYGKLFQTLMPRTAREQYGATRIVSRTELKQGDLVFFNTRGSGISHVGIYLQNNKFVHAASSGGVMVSDLFEDYWVKHFKGVGRYEADSTLQSLALKP